MPATAALQEAIEGLASGAPIAPAWASTDELGDLSAGMLTALEHLQEIPTRLQASASLLLSASTALGSASTHQRERITEQASMLQEAQLTSEEIRTTSDLASHKAESVLSVAGHAEKLGQYGEESIERTLTGLNTIGDFVDGIRGKVMRLQESATQIGGITQTVKDLADQSNMLALNAAIEAVRAASTARASRGGPGNPRPGGPVHPGHRAACARCSTTSAPAIRGTVCITEQGAAADGGGPGAGARHGREPARAVHHRAGQRPAGAADRRRGEPAERGHLPDLQAVNDLSTMMDETMSAWTPPAATETLRPSRAR